jgi:hypothetical protein
MTVSNMDSCQHFLLQKKFQYKGSIYLHYDFDMIMKQMEFHLRSWQQVWEAKNA